jgi:hypothetical protein
MAQVVHESIGSMAHVALVFCSVERVLGSGPIKQSDASMAGVVHDGNATR